MVKLKKLVRNAAVTVAPGAVDWARKLRLDRHVAKAVLACGSQTTPAGFVAALKEARVLVASQVDAEITRLLEIVSELRPKRVLEIGAANGGTLCLFSRVSDPAARIVSIDYEFGPAHRAALPKLATHQQSIVCLTADTHDKATPPRVASLLDGKPADFLFIDGDHSYESVSLDYAMYAPLVRTGGVIAFHDIHPGTNSGGVPRFWSELKARHPDALDIVEDHGQDGFGIGVLRWDGRP